MYAHLYDAHDSTLAAKQSDAAHESERQAKRQLLETSYDDLAELPALCSLIMISDAAEESKRPLHSSSCPEESAEKNAKRDGFERIKRCRMALDALDQARSFI
jgi:hypothetical protein